VVVDEITKKEECLRMKNKVSHIIVLWRSSPEDFRSCRGGLVLLRVGITVERKSKCQSFFGDFMELISG